MCHQEHPYNWSRELYALHGVGVKDYVSSVVAPAVDAIVCHRNGVDFLTAFLLQWQHFSFFNKWVSNLMRILDQTHAEPNNLPSISRVALTSFEKHVFQPNQSKITDAILETIRKEREGATVNRSLVTDTAAIYKSLDKLARLKADFVAATRSYFLSKRQEWKALDPSDYFAKAQDAINVELLCSSEYSHCFSNSPCESRQIAVEELLDKAPMRPPPRPLVPLPINELKAKESNMQNSNSCTAYLPVACIFSLSKWKGNRDKVSAITPHGSEQKLSSTARVKHDKS